MSLCAILLGTQPPDPLPKGSIRRVMDGATQHLAAYSPPSRPKLSKKSRLHNMVALDQFNRRCTLLAIAAGSMTIIEVADRTGLANGTVRKNIKAMHKDGLIDIDNTECAFKHTLTAAGFKEISDHG